MPHLLQRYSGLRDSVQKGRGNHRGLLGAQPQALAPACGHIAARDSCVQGARNSTGAHRGLLGAQPQALAPVCGHIAAQDSCVQGAKIRDRSSQRTPWRAARGTCGPGAQCRRPCHRKRMHGGSWRNCSQAPSWCPARRARPVPPGSCRTSARTAPPRRARCSRRLHGPASTPQHRSRTSTCREGQPLHSARRCHMASRYTSAQVHSSHMEGTTAAAQCSGSCASTVAT